MKLPLPLLFAALLCLLLIFALLIDRLVEIVQNKLERRRFRRCNKALYNALTRPWEK